MISEFRGNDYIASNYPLNHKNYNKWNS